MEDTMDQFDVVVIGGGPGGYVAAIRAAQLGFKTACIDEWKNAKGGPAPGGTCTNVGCIPSKALLQSSEHYEHALHHFGDHGITIKGASMDVAKMVARKDAVVKQNNDGILYLFKKNKVTFFHGRGAFAGAAKDGVYQIDVSDPTRVSIAAKQVIIATGSNARALPGVAFDEKLVLSNDGALSIGEAPKKLGVIGAGVIGLEMGSVWRRLGAEVTILEALPDFLSVTDVDVAKEAAKIFAKQGLKIITGIAIGDVKVSQKGVSIDYTDKDGNEQKLDADRLIVSIGRIPNTDGLGVDQVGLQLNARGQIEVDAHCRTNLAGVWAVGDVVAGPMLAHKAMEEGVMVAELMSGQAGHCNFDTIPWVIYTSPEIAWVGKTEQQLKAEGVAYKAGKIPFAANGRALGMGDSSGFVKMLADADTDRILGVHIIGANASELISEGVVAMEFGAASEDLARICHAHPTLSEVVHEAALACDKRPLHF